MGVANVFGIENINRHHSMYLISGRHPGSLAFFFKMSISVTTGLGIFGDGDTISLSASLSACLQNIVWRETNTHCIMIAKRVSFWLHS